MAGCANAKRPLEIVFEITNRDAGYELISQAKGDMLAL
jgi:hypothetical protein